MSTSSHNSNNTSLSPIINESNQRRCAACKHQRRRCSRDCLLSPYFPASLPHKFACVHKIFGASNVARMLQIHIAATASASAGPSGGGNVSGGVLASAGPGLRERRGHQSSTAAHLHEPTRAREDAGPYCNTHGPTRGRCGHGSAHEPAQFDRSPPQGNFVLDTTSTSLEFNYFPDIF
uniref:LOB domain-containing protein n=1 Tax=Ananas comosus var. bracteatus TaxID=296719 RepID=A0A6V7P3Y8_ANACO|nr:unnamed protein product [Ananas comosus var. bracteatus]